MTITIHATAKSLSVLLYIYSRTANILPVTPDINIVLPDGLQMMHCNRNDSDESARDESCCD